MLNRMLTDGLEWCGLLWCFLSDSYSDGTHSLQCIHCWDTDADAVTYFYKPDEETSWKACVCACVSVCVCVGGGTMVQSRVITPPAEPLGQDWGSPSGTECVPGVCVHYNRKIDLDSCSTEPHVSQVNFTEADVNPNSHRDRKLLTDTVHFRSAHAALCMFLCYY